jgi:NADPH:quinone reductase
MRAIRVHEPGAEDVLRLEELADPRPGPGEVVLRVAAAGVNFIDVYQRAGLYPMQRPYTPGTEGAGTVVAVGRDVDGLRPGDRVASAHLRGSYAELALARADQLVPVPERVDTRTAAAALLQGMTAHYLTTSTFPLRPGHTCLVHAAAGGTGQLLCQLASLRGARVIGTASTDAKALLAREAGADEVILYTQQDFAAEVKRITGGRGVDVVYDSVGRDTFDGSLDCLRPRGMMVLFGQASGPVPPFDPQLLNRKGSLFLTRPALWAYTADPQELAERAAELLGWIADGQVRVRIEAAFPLADAAAAQRALASRATAGKLLLEP